MRPQTLAPLFAPVLDLPGVGPKVAAHLESLCGPLVLDLIWHRPLRFVDRRVRDDLREVESGQTVTLNLRIGAHQVPGRRGLPLRIPCLHNSGAVTLVFFNAKAAWLTGQFPEGTQRLVSGRIEAYQGGWQMVHPDFSLQEDQVDKLPAFEPLYPGRSGLSGKILAKSVGEAVSRVPKLPDWLDASLKNQNNWPEFSHALRQLHIHDPETVDAKQEAIRRLAYDEFLAGQIALGVLRAHRAVAQGPDLSGAGKLRDELLSRLPFEPTNDQRQAMAAISAHLAGPKQAMHLVQGDVGSGKTLVALALMLQAVEAGHQAVIMAPTEILARQHADTLKSMMESMSISLECLTGKDKGVTRKALQAKIENGETHIIVGTHALFQEGVNFARLGLVVIDEQHRFGVQQRLALSQKGSAPHVILMTATPIPRTLVMTAYGDLDVSEIREKPAGRLPIQTIAKPLESIPDVLQSLDRLLQTGQQAYWICPLVEPSELLPGLASATERFTSLQKHFGDQVGLIHGQMPPARKDAAMADFKAGKTRVLVATTVIEVGVDVPNANFMVIEQAERFGLAQMHQIRGRVGRGRAQGTCLMLYASPLSDLAKQRLQALRQSNDGFDLSEQDLRLRGGGEILGTRQSGLPDLHIADYAAHGDLLKIARRDAQLLLEKDPNLTTDRGQAIRNLLYLFKKDQAARYLKVG